MAVTSLPLYIYEYHATSLSHTKLSERAFEEFDNVYSVYKYVITNCCEYADYALSNAVETCVKLCLERNGSEYANLYAPIFNFLRSERRKIASLKCLNKNVRFMAIGLIWMPAITTWCAKILKRT